MPEGAWVEELPVPPVVACPKCGDLYAGPATGHTCDSQADMRLGEVPTNVLAQLAMAPLAAPGHLGTREDIQAELDLVARSIRTFHLKQPDQVMREGAAYSARLTELCVLLHRVESSDRQYTRVRTQQVERYLTEIDRQFKVASRLLEAQRQDLELLK